MKKMVLVLCVMFFAQPVFSHNTTELCKSKAEYARQVFNQLELPLYTALLAKQIPTYLKNGQKGLWEQLPESLEILDQTALVHFYLFLLSGFANNEFPGFRTSNGTMLDRALVAQNELYMPTYGLLVALSKILPPDTLALTMDLYFPVNGVATPLLKALQRSLNNGTDANFDSKIMKGADSLYFSISFTQLLTLLKGSQSDVYKRVAKIRALYMVAYFPFLVIFPILMSINTNMMGLHSADL